MALQTDGLAIDELLHALAVDDDLGERNLPVGAENHLERRIFARSPAIEIGGAIDMQQTGKHSHPNLPLSISGSAARRRDGGYFTSLGPGKPQS